MTNYSWEDCALRMNNYTNSDIVLVDVLGKLKKTFDLGEEKMSKHLILLGDSVFDNGSYVLPGQANVNTHLKNKVDYMEWWVDLRASDGDVVADITKQINKKPIPKYSTFVLSVGGNDALGHIGILDEQIHDGSMASALLRFREIRESFRKQYVSALDLILSHKKPLIVCTIYNPKFPDADMQVLAETVLSFFNDVITEEALWRKLPIIDLRDICSDPKAFANPIEPSEIGGDLISDAIVSHISEGVKIAPAQKSRELLDEDRKKRSQPTIKETINKDAQSTRIQATQGVANKKLIRPVPPYASPGVSWSIQEERLLYEAYKSQHSCSQLAEIHGRTSGAIRSCLKRLGLLNSAKVGISSYPEFISVSSISTIEGALEGAQNYPSQNQTALVKKVTPSKPENRKPLRIQKHPQREKDECSSCGEQIPTARLEAIPGTTLCVNCASKEPAGSQNRVISETWGTRDDWNKDRTSWKSTKS